MQHSVATQISDHFEKKLRPSLSVFADFRQKLRQKTIAFRRE
jgi:hypothetical protein